MSPRTTFAGSFLFLPAILAAIAGHFAPAIARADAPVPQSLWSSDYASAMARADREGRMLVIYFFDPAGDQACRQFESVTLADPSVRAKLQAAVAVRLPLDATICVRRRPVSLLEHPAYAALGRRPGLALIDLAHKDPKLYGRVVNCVPLVKDRLCTVADLASLPDPPPSRAAEPAQPSDSSQAASPDHSAPLAPSPKPAGQDLWHDDYAKAVNAAIDQRKMLLIYFRQPGDPRCTTFEAQTLADPSIAEKLQQVVKVRLAVDAKVQEQGKASEVELLKHPSFVEMEGTAGLAILDFAHKEAAYYGSVVSTFPFLDGTAYRSHELSVILGLPPGTLTQRTLIYAVRTHPERPASTSGAIHPVLAEEAQSHSDHQARICVQGHHAWESRFHRINGRMANGLCAREVCAESWPGQGLLRAALECVRCWRLSSGHWSAVSQPHPCYGYDMKRGPNGVWYATGIFAQR